MTLVWKTPGVVRVTLRPNTICTRSGRPRSELVAQRLLKPGAPGGRAIEDAGVGQLELTDAQAVAVSGALGGGERRWQHAHPAREERLDVGVAQARADRRQRVGVIAGGEAVVQRAELDPGLGGLALGPLVPVEVHPDRVGRVGVGLDERGAPVAVVDVEVVVVDVDRLAAKLEVRVLVVAAVAPAAPRIGLLLGDTDQRHAAATLALGTLQVGVRDVLLAGALLKPHDRDLVVQGEAVDRLNVGAADPAQNRRRRDVATDAIQQKTAPAARRTEAAARNRPGRSGRPSAPAASRDRRVGLRSWPRRYGLLSALEQQGSQRTSRSTADPRARTLVGG